MTGEVLGFYGTDRATAWGEAFRLGELLVKRGAAGRMQIKACQQRGEWVVVLIRVTRGSA